jgi:hypothetical protein
VGCAMIRLVIATLTIYLGAIVAAFSYLPVGYVK